MAVYRLLPGNIRSVQLAVPFKRWLLSHWMPPAPLRPIPTIETRVRSYRLANEKALSFHSLPPPYFSNLTTPFYFILVFDIIKTPGRYLAPPPHFKSPHIYIYMWVVPLPPLMVSPHILHMWEGRNARIFFVRKKTKKKNKKKKQKKKKTKKKQTKKPRLQCMNVMQTQT